MGYRPFFLGAASGVAEVVADVCLHDIQDYRRQAPMPDRLVRKTEQDVLTRVRAAAPDLLFVAYGVPAEER